MALTPRVVTPDAFAPFGWVVEATDDGAPFGPQDAALELSQGTPRLYLMRLPPRSLQFTSFARHAKVTQCLAGLGDTPWYLAVAPPPPPTTTPCDGEQAPEVPEEEVQLFEIRPPTAVCLRRNCWHSGPHFTDGPRLFYNLELSDTNATDGNRTNSKRTFQIDLSASSGWA